MGLVFAGDGACRSLLEKQAAAIQTGRICFRGFVHREELAELYALAEGLVFPTHSDTWGLVVNEAMACGLPIIASEVAGCVSDLVENLVNGFVIPPKNVEELAKAMHKLCDRTLALSLGARSASRIQAYTPEACAAGLAKASVFACDEIEVW